MKKRHKTNVITDSFLITDTAQEGKGMGRWVDKVVFVEGAVPGDMVRARIIKDKNSFAHAIIESLESPSPHRQIPFCQHFGVCGGCKWQNLSYDAQLIFKQKTVTDALERIGKLDFGECLPIIAAPESRYYRNKLEFTFSPLSWLTAAQVRENNPRLPALGFHPAGWYDRILHVEHCHLQAEPSNQIRLGLYKFCIDNQISFYNVDKQEGLLRNLIIRTTVAGQVMVILQVWADEKDNIEIVMNFLYNNFPQITSLNYVINPKNNETFNDLEVVCFGGLDYITEYMENMAFRISPKTFFQTNSVQALTLYQITRQMAQLSGNELVYDLYSGAGSIANFISNKTRKVVGIEYVEAAVIDARQNAILNNIENTVFFAGDMAQLLTADFVAEQGRPDVVITDPPRAGMHPSVVEAICASAPARVVYVSCNPATQARDIALMAGMYDIEQVQPVDMFPHTHHVENIISLVRKK